MSDHALPASPAAHHAALVAMAIERLSLRRSSRRRSTRAEISTADAPEVREVPVAPVAESDDRPDDVVAEDPTAPAADLADAEVDEGGDEAAVDAPPEPDPEPEPVTVPPRRGRPRPALQLREQAAEPSVPALWEPAVFGPTPSRLHRPWLLTPGADVVPDTTIDGGGVPGAELRAISLRGLSHRTRGILRQDVAALGATPDGQRLVLAVADGVSAAAHSHLGAAAAARAAVELLLREFDLAELEADDLVRAVAKRIASDPAIAARRRSDPDLAVDTTLSVAVLDRTGVSDRLWVAGVGDSPVYLLDRTAGVWERIDGTPVTADGGPASPSTPALPHDVDAAWSARRTLGPHEAVFVMSDGLGGPLGPGGGEVGRYLAEAWNRAPEPLSMAMQAHLYRHTFNDDRSVAALWLEDR